jgi:hypothetical protein
VLPPVQLLGVKSLTTVVQIAAGAGVKVEPVPGAVDKLTRTVGPNPAVLTYQTEHLVYQGRFRVVPLPLPAELVIVTGADVREGHLHFIARLGYQPPPDKGNASGPVAATVRLRHWEGEVEVEVSGGKATALPGKQRGERVWQVTLPRGGGQRLLLRLRGKAPLGDPGKVLMPQVSIEGLDEVPVRRRSWVVAGEGLRTVETVGLTQVKEAGRELPAGEPDPVFPVGSVWSVTADAWRLVLASRPAAALPLKALFVEQRAEVVDDKRWLHQATYRLHVRTGGELRLTLPGGANLLALILDGNQLTPRATGPEQLGLPLSGENSVHTLRLLWTYPKGVEALEEPRLDQPLLNEVVPGPVVWVVQTPPGYRLARPPQTRGVEALSAAGVELRRAEAELSLVRMLAEGESGNGGSPDQQLATALKDFYRHCRGADHLLARSPGALLDNGPRGQSLSQWLAELRQQAQKLAQSHHFDKLRAQAEKQAQGGDDTAASKAVLLSLPERGTPSYWRSSGQVPRLSLRPLHQRQTREALSASVWLLVLVLLAAVLSFFPRVVAWLQKFWPEEAALLAWLGWQAYGFSWIGLILIVVAGYARLLWLVHWVPGLWHRKPRAAISGGSGAASGS